MSRTALLLLAAAVTVLVTSCGGGSGSDERLVVFAAASLTRVLPELDATPRYEFGGSNTLALQLRQGATADVFAPASPRFLRQLRTAGIVGPPSWFASNRLVLVVPRSNPARIRTVADLRHARARLVVAGPGVPAGDLARAALARLGLSRALRDVVSEEPDVEGVLAKVASGDADAGFVYATDARAAAGKVRAIPLPARARAVTVYGAAVLTHARLAALARGYVALLQSPPAQKDFAAAGFGPAP